MSQGWMDERIDGLIDGGCGGVGPPYSCDIPLLDLSTDLVYIMDIDGTSSRRAKMQESLGGGAAPSCPNSRLTHCKV